MLFFNHLSCDAFFRQLDTESSSRPPKRKPHKKDRQLNAQAKPHKNPIDQHNIYEHGLLGLVSVILCVPFGFLLQPAAQNTSTTNNQSHHSHHILNTHEQTPNSHTPSHTNMTLWATMPTPTTLSAAMRQSYALSFDVCCLCPNNTHKHAYRRFDDVNISRPASWLALPDSNTLHCRSAMFRRDMFLCVMLAIWQWGLGQNNVVGLSGKPAYGGRRIDLFFRCIYAWHSRSSPGNYANICACMCI